MNYKKIYKNLFLKAKDRNKDFKEENKCVEKHHFIPKSIWDKEENIDVKNDLFSLLNIKERDEDNLVYLTCREHYIAHLLLWKMYPENNSIIYAIHCFKSFNKCIINSTLYEKIKTNFINIIKNTIIVFDNNKQKYLKINKEDYNKEIHSFINDGSVNVFSKDEDKYVTVSVEEYYTNRNKYIHSNDNKVSVKDLNGKSIRISSEEYRKNKDKYIHHFKNKLNVYNKKLKKYETISKYDYDKRTHKISSEGIVYAIDKNTNEKITLNKDDYDRKIHKTFNTNKLTVFDKIENKYKLIHMNNYNKNKERYLTSGKNKVIVFDILENKNILIDKELYYSNQNRYKSILKDKVNVIEIKTGNHITISKEEYRKNKHKYKSFADGKIIVIDLKSNQKIQIHKDEFDDKIHRYITTGTIAVRNIETNEIIRISTEEYKKYKCSKYVVSSYKKNACKVYDKITYSYISVSSDNYKKLPERYVFINDDYKMVFDKVKMDIVYIKKEKINNKNYISFRKTNDVKKYIKKWCDYEIF